MKVSEFMTKNVITLTPNSTVQDAAMLMLEKNISVIPVVDSNSDLVGILTESDFVGKKAHIPHALASIKRLLGQLFYSDSIEPLFSTAKTMTLDLVMTKIPITISPEDSLTDIVNLMIRRNLKRIPVVTGKKIVGIVTRRDILKAFIMIK